MNHLARNLKFLQQQQPEITKRTLRGQLSGNLWKEWEAELAFPDPDQLIQLSAAFSLPIDLLLKRDLAAAYALQKERDIRMILLDVDGTLTDSGMYYTEAGDQIKRFHVKDGSAIRRVARRYDMEFGFISSSTARRIIEARASAIGVKRVFAGSGVVKSDIVDGWLKELELEYEQIAFIGDDLNDLSVIEKAGLSACPADAARQVKMAVDIVLQKPGGGACVREFLEEVMGYEIA